MSKETNKSTKSNRVARTIKVSTLIKIVAVILAFVGFYLVGYFTGGEEVRNHNQQVKSEASKLVSDLKSTQAK